MSLRCCVFTAFWVAFLLPEIVFSQSSLLQSGPMLGYAEQKEVLLWAQTKKEATVQFDYWDLEKPAVIHRTAKVRTEKATALRPNASPTSSNLGAATATCFASTANASNCPTRRLSRPKRFGNGAPIRPLSPWPPAVASTSTKRPTTGRANLTGPTIRS